MQAAQRGAGELIYILGGRGFVGSAFARLCGERGLRHRVIDRDSYRDLAGSSCSLLVNAAGNSRKYLAERDPLGEFDASVRGVRASLADFRADAHVLVSTCDVYPDCSAPELTREERCLVPAAQSPYGFHKSLAELCVRHAARRHLIVRAGGFVGPGLRKNPVFDILNGGPLWVDPSSELQFMSTDAFAAIVLDLAQRELWGEVFNVCGRGVVRLSEVAAIAGRRVEARPGSPRVRYEVSLDKVSRLVTMPASRGAVEDFVRQAAACGCAS